MSEEEKEKGEETFWPSGDFLVCYFHDAFSCHHACWFWVYHNFVVCLRCPYIQSSQPTLWYFAFL